MCVCVCVCVCVVSCRVVSCRVVSCRVVSCRVVSCRVVSCHVLCCVVFVCVCVCVCVCVMMGERERGLMYRCVLMWYVVVEGKGVCRCVGVVVNNLYLCLLMHYMPIISCVILIILQHTVFK